MKRKIFSKLLMGALLVASVSSFTSCKDYDDDINDLRNKIDQAALKSSLASLESQVATVKATADAALTKADADALKSEISSAKAEALAKAAEGITNAATAQAAAEAAQKTADEAKKLAQSIDLTPYVTKTELAETAEAAKTEITNALANYLTADAIEKKLADLKQEIADANEEQLEEMQTKVKNAVEGVNAIWSAVTSVELVTSNGATGATQTLSFLDGTVAGNGSKFGAAEKIWKSPAGAHTETAADVIATYSADKVVEYAKNAKIRYGESFLVRVSPANAVLSKENIKIVNSQNVSLEGVVDITSIEPYTDLITRSTSANGLWKVNVELTDAAKYNKKGYVNTEAAHAGKKVMFAVAVNNTDKEGRDVISSYDLEFVATTAYNGSIDLRKVRIKTAQTKTGSNGMYLGLINNRFNMTNGQNGDYGVGRVTLNPSSWDARFNGNRTTFANDARQGAGDGAGNYVIANIGEDIKITFDDASYKLGGKQIVDKFYVVLDDVNAQESTPSELNAWKSYTYEGLHTMFDASEGGTIKVTAMGESKDYIGFRIFAVNFDGQLVDPDGAAFYAYIADPKSAATATGSFVANVASRNVTTVPANVTNNAAYSDKNVVILDINGELKSDAAFAATGTIAGTDIKVDGTALTAANSISYQFLKTDGTAATKWSEATKVRLAVGGPILNWKDNGVGKTTLNIMDAANKAVASSLEISLTKVIPTTFPASFGFKAAQLVDGGIKVYVMPAKVTAPAWTTAYVKHTTVGVQSMEQICNGLDAADVATNEYSFTFENAVINKDNNGNANLVVKKTSTYASDVTATNLFVAGEPNYQVVFKNGGTATSPIQNTGFIDNQTAHKMTVGYVYNDVSSDATVGNDVTVTNSDYTATFCCLLNNSIMTYDWIKLPAVKGTGTDAAPQFPAKDANVIYYSIDTDQYIGSQFLMGTNSAYPSLLSKALSVLRNSHYTAAPTCKLYSKGTTDEDYFTVAYSFPAAGNVVVDASGATNTASVAAFKFTKKTGVNPPTADVPSTLHIELVDAFGHTNKYDVDVLIKLVP